VGTYGDAGLGLLGDSTRRTIFGLLAEQPRSVGELAARLPISRPAVSQHLRALKDAGLVIDRAAGTRRVYQLNPAGVAGLRAYLDQIWGDALAAFKDVVEAPHETPEGEQ
jgi:DNA-binding transcriptional ArsR family regulator